MLCIFHLCFDHSFEECKIKAYVYSKFQYLQYKAPFSWNLDFVYGKKLYFPESGVKLVG